jgi:hypothetical protein
VRLHGGCDYADVELYGMVAADTFELTLLQNPQQLCLHVAGKLPRYLPLNIARSVPCRAASGPCGEEAFTAA